MTPLPSGIAACTADATPSSAAAPTSTTASRAGRLRLLNPRILFSFRVVSCPDTRLAWRWGIRLGYSPGPDSGRVGGCAAPLVQRREELLELGVLRRQDLGLVPRGFRLEGGTLEVQLAAGELLERGAVEVGAVAERGERLVGPARLLKRLRKRAKDLAAGVGEVPVEPVELLAADHEGALEIAGREEGAELRVNRHGGEVRLRVLARTGERERALAVGHRLLRLAHGDEDLRPRPVGIRQREARRRAELGRDLDRALDLRTSLVEPPVEEQGVGDVVSGHGLFLAVAQLERQVEPLLHRHAKIVRMLVDVAEDERQPSPGREPEVFEVIRVRKRDRLLRLRERVVVEAGQEAEPARRERQLGTEDY